jgi:V/A-type H+/Na+-transporting ATPase subunit E
MEIQVQELLERIKSEGVDTARDEAAKIVAAAEEKARSVLADAEETVAELEANTKSRIAATESASKLALMQASRDSILALRGKVQDFMRGAVLATTTDVMNSEFLSKLLPDILREIAKEAGSNLSVLLPQKTLENIDSALANRLAVELKRGVEFKPFSGINAGFRIAMEGSAANYEFSAEAVADILASRVNARLAECVKNSLEGKA